ncbi:family 43 glycosylhydrolase [Nonomuraea diastatica]|uniref:Carbohydrate-binding protein n=1 Tax=Nonomuraea diastatica TaxID=1848329 RepID=A0A4R4X2M6_9ACTN|nr:family 43 glycosylhydrolase [Nonomuraea diastatica]TDD24480.1 carbohydrate-binding protein [Nonomuraea diastatica]
MGLSGRLIVVLPLVATFAAGGGEAGAATAAVPPPAIIEADFPDPDVIRAGSTFYAYSTSSRAGRIPVAEAPSPTGPWTVRGDALPGKPSWAGDGGFWAPDVTRRADGHYLMYFTGPSTATKRMCIGAALSPTPLGPFRPIGDGPLVCDPAEGGDIDPSSFVDTDGTRYLLYKVVRGSRVRYEAERGTVNHAEVRTGAAGASQGAVVAKLDHADSWVDIRVFAPVGGTYTANVAYAAGYGDAQHTLTVNGSAQATVNYPDRGWDNWTQVQATVSLAAGWNTLRLRHLTRWAELDYVELA